MQQTVKIGLSALFFLVFFACQESATTKENEAATESVAVEQATDPGLVHVVYFWAKDSISADERQQLEAGLKNLANIKSVRRLFVGKPAKTTNRAVVDNTFDYSLQIWFDDVQGHDAYQIDPIHTELVKMKDLWSKVVVRDNIAL